ncbi:MAG: hypothetical protein ACLFRI_00575 [Candidatus Izemoplasmataceae bacterium]
MKKEDMFFIALTLGIITLLIIPTTNHAFFSFTNDYILVGGFIKFFIFATYGDLLSHRIRFGNYRVSGLAYKASVWGFIGIMITYIFRIFPIGITFLQSIYLLPFHEVAFFHAFFISLFMNLTFAPTMMLFHRISDDYIDQKIMQKNHRLNDTLKTIDYSFFIRFVVFKTIPLFWIPAHTITFLLPSEYRVFFAAILGVMLGLILGLSKPNKKELV